MKNNKGFSLVELIVVIAIMAILAAVAIPTFAHFIGKANAQSDATFVADTQYALELAYAQFDADVSDIAITTEDGEITMVKYTVGEDYDVAIAVTDGKAGTPVCDNTTALDKEYTKAAGEFLGMVDWSYNFKSSDNLNLNPHTHTYTDSKCTVCGAAQPTT